MPSQPGEVVLEAEGLCAKGDRGVEALHDVSLAVRAGEVLGVAGVAGNGQRELAEVLTGMRPASAGHVRVGGSPLRGGDPRAAIRAGVAHVPEDRLRTGVAPSLSIASNVARTLQGRRAVAWADPAPGADSRPGRRSDASL